MAFQKLPPGRKIYFVKGVPNFISEEAREDFIKYSQDIADQGRGQVQGKSTDPNIKTGTKLAKLMGVGQPSVERAQNYFRSTGDITAADYLEDTKRYVERFMPEAQNPDGSFSAEKYSKLSDNEKAKVKSNRLTLDKFLDDPNTKTRANDLKRFIDDYRKLKTDGKGYRMFLGANFDKPWMTPSTEALERRTVSKRPTLDTLTELWKGGAYAKNPQTASALQMVDGYNSPENKAYLKDLKEIRQDYLTDAGKYDLSLKDRDGLAKRYMDDIYKKDLPEFYKSEEFRNADNVGDIIKKIRKKFSNPLLYPASGQAGGAFDVFGKATSHDYRGRPLTEAGGRRLVGGFIKHQPTASQVFTDLTANYLETPKGKEALGLLDEFVDLNKEFKKLNPQDVDSWEKYNKLATKVKKLKFDSPKLDIFLKPLVRLGIIKTYEGGKRIPVEELEARREVVNVRPTMESLQKYYKEKGLVNPIKPATFKFFLAKDYEKASRGKYVAAYQAGLNKILQGTYFKTPVEYQNAVKKLNRVLTLQLGGLGISAEHRVGVKMLDVLKDPDYVAKMVLSPQKFNAFKGQYIEKALTPIMNNPRATAAAKKTASERVHGKFFKDFGITPEMQKTYPKFEVVGTGKEAILKETQVGRTVGKFGLGETMGDLKKTVKDVLVEQSLTEKVLRGRNQYKSLSEIARTTGAMKWAQEPQFKKIGIQNIDKVQNILNVLSKEGPESTKVDNLISSLVEGEFEKTVNAESMKAFGKTFSSDIAKQHPGLIQKAFQKVSGKGGRIGALLTGLGAVGAGTWAMMGGAEAEETPTTEQMTYNSTTGEFDNAEGDPETQEGILNWIADHPIYSGLAPIPIGIGVGLGAEAMGAKQVGNFFKSMKFILPPAYAAEKLHQYKRGDDMGQMFANPIDAVWAMALDTKDSRNIKWEHYKNLAKTRPGWGAAAATKAGEKAAIEAEQLGLHPRTWKNIGKATMAPASRGTRLVFPFGTKGYGFGDPKKLATKGLARFAGIGARMLPLGPLPMALLAGSMAWDKYKFNKKVGDHVDALRAKGVVSEEDAQSMNTIYKQGWLGTTAIGAKILGSEELMLDGELADIEKQKEVLAKMKEFHEGREQKESYQRAGERQEDFFDWFSKGGRVGLAEGGNKSPFSMTRRGFLKWLIGSIVTGVAAVSGRGLKQAAKTTTATVAKTPTKFIGVEGMPAWFPRAIAKIKTHGKLIELADKKYIDGDKYEMILKNGKKVMMEDNPLSGEINISWHVDDFDGDMIRQINFKPGQAGYQKFGVDDPTGAAQGVTEYKRVKVEEPEFTYGNPDQSQPYRDEFEFKDIFTEGDDTVKALEDMTTSKQMVTKDGTVIDVSPEGKGVEEAFQKKIFKDIEGEEAIIPEPEGVGVTKEGNVYGEEQFNEIIEGVIPDHLKKKAEGGIIETGNIARRPGAVPPLSGPNPQGTGIVGLFSNPKRVNVV